LSQLEQRIQLLNQYFFARRDIVAVRQSWIDRKTGEIVSQPRPVIGDQHLDALLAYHVAGPESGKAPPLYYFNRKTGGQVADGRGFDRVGAYTVAPDNSCVWLCLDFDGPGHPLPLADPLATMLACVERCGTLGIHSHLEKSGGGHGWHLWIFFEGPVPAADARMLGHSIAPTGHVLATGEAADVRTGRGIECFPKQNTVSDKPFRSGNMMWLPHWFGAKDGGNQFYQVAEDGSLAPYAPDGFERLSATRLQEIIAQVPDEIRRFVLKTKGGLKEASAPKSSPPAVPGNYAPTDADLIRSALDHISPDVSYDDWLRIGMALHHWDAQAGLSLWDVWSARGEKYVAGEPSLKWDGFTSGGGVTLGTLFDMAKKAGWEPPAHERTPLPTDEEIAAFMDVDPALLLDQVKPGKKRDVLECLIEAGKPLAPKEIAERLGRDQNATRVLLHRMVKDGQLVKDENDHYTQRPDVTPTPTETITSGGECNAGSNENHYIAAGCNAQSNVAITSRCNGADAPRLPTVVVKRQMRHEKGDAWAVVRAANYPPKLFQRKNSLVSLVGSVGAPMIVPVGETELQGYLSDIANWVLQTKDMEIPVHPPKDVVAVMVASPDPSLPHIDGVVSTPVFSQDGTLVSAPGYHREAQLWMHYPRGFAPVEIPEKPTVRQIDSARRLLLDDLLVDFPFAAESDRAHAVAALLLPFVRRMIDGPTPLHLIESPSPGTGKSLLAKTISKIAQAKKEAECIPLAKDDNENSKKITSILSHTPQVILLDNVAIGIRSAMLASVLTTTEWTDRLLGASRMITLPNQALWLATANNPTLTLEMARRCVRIRIDSRHDRPWLLSDFKHVPLDEWVEEYRSELIAGLLTIIRGWIADGKRPEKISFGSFDAWARTIGGILRFAGIPGFLGHLEELYEAADTEGNEWREFTAAWWDRFGARLVAAAELLGLATEKGLLASTIGDGGPQSQKIRIGRALSAMRDRQFDVYRITTRRDSRTKNLTYGLMNVTDGIAQAPGEVVDLFTASRSIPTAPTADSPQEKPLKNQGSTVSAVSAVNNSPDAYTHTRTQVDGDRQTNPPQTPHPPQPPSGDLADFDPQEEES